MFQKIFQQVTWKKTGLYGTIYDFSADYGALSVDDILSIHKYLIKKHNIVLNVWICKANIYFSSDVFSCSLPIVNSLKCVSMNNQKCKVRPDVKN